MRYAECGNDSPDTQRGLIDGLRAEIRALLDLNAALRKQNASLAESCAEKDRLTRALQDELRRR